MKDIDEFVNELPIEKKNEIVKSHYSKMMREEIVDSLQTVAFAVMGYRTLSHPVVKKAMQNYELKKSKLIKLNLYDERYEEQYKLALQEKLNSYDLENIK